MSIINKARQRVITISALLIFLIAIVFSLNTVWGVFMLTWIVNDIIRQETYLLGHIPRADYPVMFWFVICTYLAFSLMYLLY